MITHSNGTSAPCNLPGESFHRVLLPYPAGLRRTDTTSNAGGAAVDCANNPAGAAITKLHNVTFGLRLHMVDHPRRASQKGPPSVKTRLPASAWRIVALVLRRLLQVVDHQHIHWTFLRFQLQPELLL